MLKFFKRKFLNGMTDIDPGTIDQNIDLAEFSPALYSHIQWLEIPKWHLRSIQSLLVSFSTEISCATSSHFLNPSSKSQSKLRPEISPRHSFSKSFRTSWDKSHFFHPSEIDREHSSLFIKFGPSKPHGWIDIPPDKFKFVPVIASASSLAR